MSRLFAVLIPVIISCAAPNTHRPDITKEELDNEMILQMEDAFRISMAKEARLDSIVETIVWDNAPLCGNNIKKRYGFYYLDKATLSKSKISHINNKLLLRWHGLDEVLSFPIITGIVPGSPADSSGLMTGDIIISVGGRSIQESKHYGMVRLKKGGIVKKTTKRKMFKGDTTFLLLIELSHDMSIPVPFTIKRGDSTLEAFLKLFFVRI